MHSVTYLWDFAILISLSIILMYRYTKKDKNPRWFELIFRFLSWFSFINWGIILFATKNNSQNTNYGITSISDILLRLSLFFKACSSKINWTFYDSRKLQTSLRITTWKLNICKNTPSPFLEISLIRTFWIK